MGLVALVMLARDVVVVVETVLAPLCLELRPVPDAAPFVWLVCAAPLPVLLLCHTFEVERALLLPEGGVFLA